MKKTIYLIFLMIPILTCAFSTPVADIKDDPNKFHDKQITVSGTVTETITIPILGLGLWELDDGTGTIWVKPAGDVPSKGERKSVTGTIKVGMTISNRTFGLILIEKSQQIQQ